MIPMVDGRVVEWESILFIVAIMEHLATMITQNALSLLLQGAVWNF